MTDEGKNTRQTTDIRARDRDAIIQSLRTGLVPRRGLQHIQVGRSKEVKAVTEDLNRIADGGSAVRFIIGDYGSGKTFFLNLMRTIAMEKRLVTAHADLTPERRLQSSQGKARALYNELIHNLSTRASPDGGALRSIVQRFVATARAEATKEDVPTEHVIRQRLREISELVGGYDFAEVIATYWEAHQEGDEVLEDASIRWLRGEFGTKTEARKAVGVRTIIDDSNIYQALKLLARFVRLAGYEGLLVNLDEMVNLYKISHGTARKTNYEKLLSIVNDGLQGEAVGLGFLFGGTPDFLTDPRRGVYSYEALKSRLSENTFASGDLVDMTGPVTRLSNLTQEDMYVLLQNLRNVYAGGDPDNYLVPDEALQAFMEHCYERVGASYFQTPRNTIKAFLGMLAVLEQNPETSWEDLVGEIEIEPNREPGAADQGEDDKEESDSAGDDELTDLEL
jgi:hypothetical protein